MEKLRVGIIGCGQICRIRHAPEYQENDRCEIVGFYDIDPVRSQAMSAAFGGKAFSSLDDMFSAGVNAVSVCSANTDHRRSTVMALEHGCDVLCEKPLGVLREDCEEMLEAACRTGRRLLAGHNQRMAPAHREARRLIAEGAIGRILTFHTTFGHAGPENWTGQPNPWFFHRDKAVLGVAADLGIHKIDLYNYLTGDVVTHASAYLTTLDKKTPDGLPIQVDDNALFILRTQGGAVGAAHASWTFYGQEDNSTILYGTKGVMKLFADPEYAIVVERPDGQIEKYAIDKIATNAEQKAGKHRNTGVINEFVDAVLTGRPSCLDVKEIIHAMRVVFAAIRSESEGRSIFIEQSL